MGRRSIEACETKFSKDANRSESIRASVPGRATFAVSAVAHCTLERNSSRPLETLVTHFREIAVTHADASAGLAQEVLKEAEYFATNANRMRYPEFLEKGFFVGSGVVEAGCKSVIGSRLKRSGVFWTFRGANAITRPALLPHQSEVRGLLGVGSSYWINPFFAFLCRALIIERLIHRQ
jgi:hypothetical protein